MKASEKKERHRLAREPLHLPTFANRGAAGPFVVAIEGANGAGKTTLCQVLAKTLSVPSCLGTDDAWFSESFKTRMIRDAEWFSSAMFFLSGCFERIRVLRSWPDPLVIMDRSFWSTFAVHGAENPERLAILVAMLKPVADKIQPPDLTIVLEASFETCQSRIARKSGTARLLDELTAAPEFHDREREFYHWLARERSEVQFLDVNQGSPGSIASRAAALIQERTGPRKRAGSS